MNICIFENNKKYYIITYNSNSQYLTLYDLNGQKIKEIKTPNEHNLIVESYNNFIISGNINCCTSYNFNNKILIIIKQTKR